MWFYVRSVLVWGWMVVLSFAWIPMTLLFSLTIPFDRRRRLLLWESHLWCRTVARTFPTWRIQMTGLEHIEPGRHYVVMANHSSLTDILLLSRLPLYFRWVSKREIFLVPIFGWQMWVFGHLSVKRGDRGSVERFLRAARRTLESGLSILIFPEGTRSRTGELGSFKPGGFQLASETGTAILPVVVGGSGNVLPKGSLVLRDLSYPCVRVLAPIPVERGEDPAALARRVRDAMLGPHAQVQRESAELLAKWQAELGITSEESRPAERSAPPASP